MSKYRIVLTRHPDITCSGYYTNHERAIKRCIELNKFSNSNKYSVKEFKITHRMSVEERANYLYENHKDEYLTAKEEIINNLSKSEQARIDKHYLIWLRVTRKLKHLIPNN